MTDETGDTDETGGAQAPARPDPGSEPPGAAPAEPSETQPSSVEPLHTEPLHTEQGGAGQGGAGQTEIEIEPEELIDDATMRRALEAILMVTDAPLASVTLARAVGRSTGDVAEALTALAGEYAEQHRGFELREVAGGWRYYTSEDAAPYVERFVLDGQQARLTQASLETLAVVAYKQPVSRARVSAIRGVNVDGVMRTLVSRGLVEEAGTDTESQATLYRTTSYFLERMGMQSLGELPELAPYLPEMDDVEDELAAQDPQIDGPGAAPAAGPGPETDPVPSPAPEAGPGPGPSPGPVAEPADEPPEAVEPDQPVPAEQTAGGSEPAGGGTGERV